MAGVYRQDQRGITFVGAWFYAAWSIYAPFSLYTSSLLYGMYRAFL